MIAVLLAAIPFLFYLYRLAPQDQETWDLGHIIIYSGGFYNVQAFIHAVFTKVTFLIITTIWFFSCYRWWRFAILIPFTMFLFQLSGVFNFAIEYIDEYDFWYSLPIVLPIVIMMTIVSVRLNRNIEIIDLKDEIDQELKNMHQS